MTNHQASVWWAITPKNRRIPLDPPGRHEQPNVQVWRDGAGILRTGEPPHGVGSTMTTSHFATCPEADKHRRRRNGK